MLLITQISHGDRACVTGPSHARQPSSTGVLRNIIGSAAAILAAHGADHAASRQQAAAAHGSISLHGSNDSYNAHPAMLDASLHLGALLAAADTGASGQQSAANTVTVRVPSALAAFWAPSGGKQAQTWATAGNVSLQPDDSALSSYWLASPDSGGASMQQLLAKPMTGAPRAAPKSAAQEQSGMLYTLHWKAAEAAAVGAAPAPAARARPRRHALAWRTIGRHGASRPADTLLLGSSAVGGMSAAGLARIQQVLAGGFGEAAGLQLRTSAFSSSGPGKPGRLSSASAAAGASGLLRTAAQEFPAMKWQAQAGDALASRQSAAAAAGIGTDAFGVRMSDGVAFLPQMLPAQPELATSGAAPLSGQSGSVIISGGLGDIGAMLGVWAGQNPALHVHLLGRSGHVPPSLSATIAGIHYVTISRCDVGTPEETRALSLGGPLRQIWHAGGILQDVTLPKQTAATMRAAAAPKLAGVLNLMAAMQGSPLENVALFSSTAALLGPAGQGNYAAANSQLNAWAQHAQATGGPFCPPLWSYTLAVLLVQDAGGCL